MRSYDKNYRMFSIHHTNITPNSHAVVIAQNWQSNNVHHSNYMLAYALQAGLIFINSTKQQVAAIRGLDTIESLFFPVFIQSFATQRSLMRSARFYHQLKYFCKPQALSTHLTH